MRTLLVLPNSPQNPGELSGKQRRTRLFIEAIAASSDQIELLYFVPDTFQITDDSSSINVWGVEGRSVFAEMQRRPENFFNHYIRGMISVSHQQSFFPFCGPQQRQVIHSALERKPDLIFVDEIRAMQPVLDARSQAPILFDMNDLVHRVQWRMATAGPFRPGKLAYAAQVPAILAAEYRAIRASACTCVCSEPDRQFIAALGAGKRAVVIPNAVSIPKDPPGVTLEPTLLFIGSYGYEPNVLAVRRLIDNIWPLVRSRRPDARLLIAGPFMERLPYIKENNDNIEYLGFVDKLSDLYSRSRIVCCPITVGGGTRLKLIEAAAYGRPMVSTRVGAEGLQFEDGKHILIRDTDEDFAEACTSLLEHDTICSNLGSSAYALTSLIYDPEDIKNNIKKLIQHIL